MGPDPDAASTSAAFSGWSRDGVGPLADEPGSEPERGDHRQQCSDQTLRAAGAFGAEPLPDGHETARSGRWVEIASTPGRKTLPQSDRPGNGPYRPLSNRLLQADRGS